MSESGERRIALAAVAGAHGVKGEVRLKLFSDSVESLSRHKEVYVGGAKRRLLSVRDSGKTAVEPVPSQGGLRRRRQTAPPFRSGQRQDRRSSV